MQEAFRKFAHKLATLMGTPWAFLSATTGIVIWAISGPLFHYAETWELVINTGTTIITFLMVFLIQNTQNRDAQAVHLKLDELLRALETARTGLVNLEDCSDEQLQQLQEEFRQLRTKQPALLDDDLEAIDQALQKRQQKKSVA